jgi:hypothetical protein
MKLRGEKGENVKEKGREGKENGRKEKMGSKSKVNAKIGQK